MLRNAKGHINNDNNLVVVHIVESFAGGTFDFLVNLTQEIKKYKHIIIHGKRKDTPVYYKTAFPENVTLIYWQNAKREISFYKDSKALIELLNILNAIPKIDIIHVHSSKAGFLGRIAALIIKKTKRVIYTPHGISFLRKDISAIKKCFYIFLEFIASFMCKYIVCCSNSERKCLNQKFINNALVIENGVNNVNFLNLIDKAAQKSNKNNEFIVATMGRITAAKNPKLFNEIAKSLIKEKINFMWIGDGEERDKLSAQNILVTGWLKQTEALKALQECDVYLSTSLWEGMPLAVLNAMSLAKPLVLSKCVGNIDVNKNNNVIFYTGAEEAVTAIINIKNNKSLRVALAQDSYIVFQQYFTINKMCSNYQKLYLKMSERK